MDTVGVFEAKTHFSEIIDRVVQGGAEMVITRHGKPVAKIVPFSGRTPERQAEIVAAIAGLFRLREKQSLKGISIRALIDDGRKY